jgi:hypothetical protein
VSTKVFGKPTKANVSQLANKLSIEIEDDEDVEMEGNGKYI